MSKRVLITNCMTFVGMPCLQSMLTGPFASEFGRFYLHDLSFKDPEKRAQAEKAAQAMAMAGAGNGNGKSNISALVSACSSVDATSLASEIGSAGVDVLINNDGYGAKRAAFTDISEEEMRETLNALTIFPFRITSLLVKGMCERRQGKVIFLTSATAFVGLPNYAAYVIARGATNTMAITLAKEVAPFNVIVNAVAPNFVESETYFPKRLFENKETANKILGQIPLKRLGKPREAGDLVAYLASDTSSFVTGQVIRFAGGWC